MLYDIMILATKTSDSNFKWFLSEFSDKYLSMLKRIKKKSDVGQIYLLCSEDKNLYNRILGGLCEIIVCENAADKESGYGLFEAAHLTTRPFYFVNSPIFFNRIMLSNMPKESTSILYSEAKNRRMGVNVIDSKLINFTKTNNTEWCHSGFISDKGAELIRSLNKKLVERMFLMEYIIFIRNHIEDVSAIKIKKNWINMQYESKRKIIEAIHG
jgi:hypothetical protein